MPISLEVKRGVHKGEIISVHPGDSVEIGRCGRDVAIPEDTAMSSAHFLLNCDAAGAVTLADLESSNGTFVNAVRVTTAKLVPGDLITAGKTLFCVLPEQLDPRSKPPEPIQTLRAQKAPLYAVLDGARDPKILELLTDSGEDYDSLYEGKSAQELEAYAPYIFCCAPESSLLDSLIADGWGRSWGIYLACDGPMRDVRNHLRHFLLAEVAGRTVYFRFYDPRVLRAYLPTCTTSEAHRFFGPVRAFYCERDDSTVATYSLSEFRGGPAPSAAAKVSPLLAIRPAQLEALSASTFEGYVQRVARRLHCLPKGANGTSASPAPEQAVRTTRLLIDRARSCGFEREREVTPFILMTATLGTGYETGGLGPWISAILASADVSPENRMDAICALLSEEERALYFG
jgi:Domain of unknown function (DUF4123)/Inner membrane component of T3SS, cytoplasmic domain